MKLQSTSLPWKGWRGANKTRAFTLTEMVTALAIFSLIAIALCSLQIVGFQMSSLTESKLISIGYSLTALNAIRDEVRSASSVVVGNGTGSGFKVAGAAGNTMQIYPTTNSNYIQVYLDTNTTALYMLNSSNQSPFLIASNIINEAVFQTVNYQGNISTNTQEHYAIKMTLQFRQLAYRIPVNTYDYYTLQATMTPRTQN